jgi:hypothetical protein
MVMAIRDYISRLLILPTPPLATNGDGQALAGG